MGFNRIASWSGCSALGGPVSASRTAPGTSIARKTRQRSPSSAGMLADLELDAPGALQRRLTVIDERREPGRGALRAVEIHGRSQHQDDGEMYLFGATLEHGGDHEATVGRDDAGHTPGSQ